MAANVEEVLSQYEKAKTKKSPWLPRFQLLAEYFLSRKANFTSEFNPGDFMDRDLYDATGSNAARIMGAALLGMLWPSGAQSFKFTPPMDVPSNPSTKKFYERSHAQVAYILDDSEAGLVTALDEFMRDEVVFGTSGIAALENIEERNDVDLIFCAWDIKNMCIAEGKNRRVDTVFYYMEKPLQMVVKDYGLESLSEELVRCYRESKDYDKKVKLLHVIRPRRNYDENKEGNLNMPWESLTIEIGAKHLIKESGFEQLPVFVARFMKNINEELGRSPAMEALPDVLEINSIREAEIIAVEKILDPPLGVLDDGALGNATIDTSAGALNVFNFAGRMGINQPIFPLFTVGDLRPIKDRMEELKQSISDHFLIDKLLDFNNENTMTLGEVKIREKMRGWTLSTVLSRQIAEVFDPLIKYVFNWALKKGRLGVVKGSFEELDLLTQGKEIYYIPDEILKAMTDGRDVYKIEYLTPAARLLQAEVASGIMDAWKFANEVIATKPHAADYLDEDLSIKLVTPLLGAPQILRDDLTVSQIRAVRAKQLEEQAKRENAIKEADALSKAGKGVQALAGAGSTTGGV